MKAHLLAVAVSLVTLATPAALAQTSASVSATEGVSAKASTSSTDAEHDSPDEPFWRRHRPLPLAVEAGFFGGITWISDDHNLQDLSVVTAPGAFHRTFDAGPHWGLRAAFYPTSWVGAEGEFGFLLTSLKPDGTADIVVPRGHVIFQLPLARVVPFVLVGGGAYAVTESTMGKDVDPTMHFGGGVKVALTQRVAFRVDVRDTIVQKNKLLPGVENGDVVHNGEVLAGFSLTIGRTGAAPAPVDSDGDGIPDSSDRCPTVAAATPDGCPQVAPPVDSDGDGIPDDVDRCPNEPEDGREPDPKDGCPNKDADNDGIPIPQDLCPDVPGVAPDGCPVKDTDGDGIPDKDDKCPEEAETKNGFQDEDGCPDELPKEVAKFTGAIKGIEFDFAKATLRPASFPTLDEAVKVLVQYPTLRLKITGHTDDQGAKEVNQKLSEERAEAVKTYLVGKGVDDKRIETHGAGPDEPVGDNKTEAGRAKNRRIEFQVLH